MIITLSGYPGSGKSTVKELLSKELGLKKYSAGDMRGKLAMERGITIDELNRIGLTDPSTDAHADEYQAKLGKTEDNFVIDGRVSWHFIPHSYKVYLKVDPQLAAERVFKARTAGKDRADEPDYASVEETKATIQKRYENDRVRYQKWYNIDFWDESKYDLVIDTTGQKAEETVQQILKYIKANPKAA